MTYKQEIAPLVLIAPLIFEASTRKDWKVKDVLLNDAWISKIKLTINFTVEHIRQFINLWTLINDFHLEEHVEDEIIWKHIQNGQYLPATAYLAQFLGSTYSPMPHAVWKAWASAKVKFFAWLVIQDRIWIADRLAKHRWPNYDRCPLCKRVQESSAHLFYKCIFTLRLWALVNSWLHMEHMDTSTWHLEQSVKDWWVNRSNITMPNRKARASLTMLISWVIWNERNARVFRNKFTPTTTLFNNIKIEARLWVTVGAKKLGTIIPGE
ncbi:Serine carboxypeptidase-like 18 [Hordeum vulgare]|nr:Serine carboxypeptidase-like 18 [Hordeum vulgare]KAE8813131.1 Serine carboxypeptidase-like 18 [Hordeum vulgare]